MTSGKIKLIRPLPEYAEQVMAYKVEMQTALSDKACYLHGCAGLEECDSFDEWVDFDRRLGAKYGDAYVPSDVYLAIRESDDRLVGIMDFRHPLTPAMLQCSGHIGYSVRPSERRKGYCTEMLRQLLPLCVSAGEKRVLITCAKENIASAKVILANGGVLENEVPDSIGLAHSGIVQRYWINLC